VVLLTRKLEFSASHRLWCDEWDEARNRAVFGAWARPFAHGHNYRLDVTLRGEIDGETGMVMDLKHLSGVMDAEVGERFDHRDLCEDGDWFSDRPATAENFAQLIFDLLDRALPEGALHAVRLAPVPDLSVEVTR
jgi:6-pyruvoyltetrahydropterin/6-carboxytetrahydropterin synthase